MRGDGYGKRLDVFSILLDNKPHPLEHFDFLNLHHRTLKRILTELQDRPLLKVYTRRADGRILYYSDYKLKVLKPIIKRKKCCGCGMKPIGEFTMDKSRADGFKNYCKKCCYLANKTYYERLSIRRNNKLTL